MKYFKIEVLLILSFVVCLFDASAQNKEGDIELKAGNYRKAISYYLKEDLSTNIAYHLAKCYAMTGQDSAAFYYLNFLVEQEKENLIFSALEDIKEFENIKTHAEWEKLSKKYIQYQNAYEAQLNIPLRDSILEMRRVDNTFQEKYDSIMLTNDSVLIQSFKEEWKTSVKENDLELAKIIDTYGWPTKELVGDNAIGEVFFLVQHSLDVELQKKCLKKLKQVFDNHVNNLIQIAYLEDRILVTTRQKQLYGTQYKKGKMYPVDDSDNLNRRRTQIGLAPVQFIPTGIYAQNLIPNYSFELYSDTDCPKFLREIDGGWERVGGEGWVNSNKNDNETHSVCFKHICKDQTYFNSFSGNAYITYSTKLYKSIYPPRLFQVELKDSLIKGEEYLIEYYIRSESRSDFAETAKNDVCIFLLKHKYHFELISPRLFNSAKEFEEKSTIKENFKITPDILFYENKPVKDFSEWTKVSKKYVAKGWEKYFLIGSYGRVKNRYFISIDNITLQKAPKNKIDINNAKVGEAIVLENISFEPNSSKLTDLSFSTLNQLVELFNSYPNLIIEIAGHTDNIGHNDLNLKLSVNRAKSVVGYLVAKGVDLDKLKAKGYGGSKPISNNKTEKGKRRNRRVEFKILQR
jgi:outer membrane protein OmpA-like peptidoglycan-associated protein